MEALIKIKTDKNLNRFVSGRDLHMFLEVKARYNDWFSRMSEYGFVEGVDFYSNLSKSSGGRPSVDHLLTIDMAKQRSHGDQNYAGDRQGAGVFRE